jgi:cytoskeletal protein RodZ
MEEKADIQKPEEAKKGSTLSRKLVITTFVVIGAFALLALGAWAYEYKNGSDKKTATESTSDTAAANSTDSTATGDTASSDTSNDSANIDIDSELSGIDKNMDSVTDAELADTALADSEIGL